MSNELIITLCIQLQLVLISFGIFMILGRMNREISTENLRKGEVSITWKTVDAAYTLYAGLFYLGQIYKGETPTNLELWMENAQKIRKHLLEMGFDEDANLINKIDEIAENLTQKALESDESDE